MNKTMTNTTGNHQTYDKKPVSNTTNYPKDSHKAFCKRCLERYHEGICPITGTSKASSQCDI